MSIQIFALVLLVVCVASIAALGLYEARRPIPRRERMRASAFGQSSTSNYGSDGYVTYVGDTSSSSSDSGGDGGGGGGD